MLDREVHETTLRDLTPDVILAWDKGDVVAYNSKLAKLSNVNMDILKPHKEEYDRDCTTRRLPTTIFGTARQSGFYDVFWNNVSELLSSALESDQGQAPLVTAIQKSCLAAMEETDSLIKGYGWKRSDELSKTDHTYWDKIKLMGYDTDKNITAENMTKNLLILGSADIPGFSTQ